MKKLRTKLMAAVSIFAVLAAVSCSSDDNENNNDGGDDGNGGGTNPTEEATFEYFTPLYGEAGTTLSIVGENLGTDVDNVKVWFDDTELPVTDIRNGVRIDVTLPQMVGNQYSVRVKVGDHDTYTFDDKFAYILSFSEVSTAAGIAGQSGNTDGAAASATFYKPMILTYDKKDDAVFVSEDHESGGSKLRRLRNGQVETLLDYTQTPANNIRAVAMSVTADTVFLANDRGGNTDKGVVYIAKRSDDFKTISCLIGPAGSSPEVESDGQHFNHLAVHPKTGKLYMYDWRRYVYEWNTASGTANVVADLTEIIPGSGNYSSLTFSKDGSKIYVVCRNESSMILIADYDMSRDEISGEFKVFAGATDGTQGYEDATGTEARFSEPFHSAGGADGYLYVGEMKNFNIRRVTNEGKVTTITGIGTWGYVDGPLSGAAFDAPASLVFDNESNMYVADFYNHVIRKLTVVK